MPLIVLLLAAAVATAPADEDSESESAREQSHNYILERQQAYQVEGVPTERIIIGTREIDVYPNAGLMFEGNNVVDIIDNESCRR